MCLQIWSQGIKKVVLSVLEKTVLVNEHKFYNGFSIQIKILLFSTVAIVLLIPRFIFHFSFFPSSKNLEWTGTADGEERSN